MKKRSVCFVLLAVMLLTAACGGGSSASTDETNAGQTSAVTTEPETEPEIISKALPTDKDYGGHEFTFLTNNSKTAGLWCYEYAADEMNGDVMNDAVYQRNAAVGEQFNVGIAIFRDSGYAGTFNSMVLAGDDNYDVFVAPTTTVLKKGYLYGLSTDKLPYIDLSRDWWDSFIMDQTALGGVHYALTGDINLLDDDSIWAIYFNKRLAKDYKVGDLYQMVYDGKWTIDALKVACANATVDLNGDGVLDYKDQWGLVASNNSAASILWSAGGMLGKMKADHTMELTMSNAHNVDVMEKIYGVFSQKNAVAVIGRDIPDPCEGVDCWTYSYNMFINGRILLFGYPLYTLSNFRNMEDDFGYLPCPKYDEEQKDYYSIQQEWIGTCLLVPRSASDPERTSIVLEAMASASSYYTVPAYYDVVLTRKYARDDQSEKIIDILRANRQFDLAYAYDFGSVRSTVSNALIADSNTIASSFASALPKIQTAYEDTLKAIADAQKDQ